MRPPSLQTALIILSSSSTTMKSSSVSFVEERNSVSVSAVAPPAGCRNVPEIGFIVTVVDPGAAGGPLCALTCASGLAPTARCPGVETRKVQYAPRSCSSSARNQVRPAVSGSTSTRAVKSRRITKFAPSPRPISSAMTVRTISAYSSSGMSKPASARATGSAGSAASTSARGSEWWAVTTRQRSGAWSSWQSKPRSTTCRNGTRASTSRGAALASCSGMSASRSTSTTSPVRSSTVSASRAIRAKGSPERTVASSRVGLAVIAGPFSRSGGLHFVRERKDRLEGGLCTGYEHTASAGGPPGGAREHAVTIAEHRRIGDRAAARVRGIQPSPRGVRRRLMACQQ